MGPGRPGGGHPIPSNPVPQSEWTDYEKIRCHPQWVEKYSRLAKSETREVALANLDDAVKLFEDETGKSQTEAELEAMGIDPAANTTGDQEPPDPLK